MTKVNILIYILLFATNVFSQLSTGERSNTVADCANAIEIIHFNETNIQFTGSYGFLDELNDINSNSFEQNSVWLKLDPQINGEMTIDFQRLDNFNFEYYLFIDSTGNFCTDDYEDLKSESLIEQGEILFKETENFNPASPTKLLFNSKSNIRYYLLLHSKEVHQKSLKLIFSLNGKKKDAQIYVQNYKRNAKQKSVTIKLRDKYTKKAIIGNITVAGLKVDNQLFMGSDFVFDAYNNRASEISINAEGYFLNISENRISALNDSEIIIELEPLAVGKKLKLEGVIFQLNSKDFLPISYVALKHLLEFMILNSSINIEIHGHVHAPGDETSVKAKKLSENRAKNAYQYLVENGIAKNRMTYVGKGATEMINPRPKNREEEELNRRVEFLITE